MHVLRAAPIAHDIRAANLSRREEGVLMPRRLLIVAVASAAATVIVAPVGISEQRCHRA